MLAPGPPLSPRSKQLATSNASGLRREVFGFATAGSLADPTYGYPSWNFDLLSTVAFFAINVRYDGQIVGDANFSVYASSVFTDFVNTAHAHGTKVVVTIVGPHNPVDQCDALYNAKTQTIPQLLSQITLKGADGVNIDYEGQIGPCTNVIDPTLDTTNQALITKLAKDMRAGLDAIKPGLYLSMDTYSGSASGNDGFFNIPAINPYVDAFFVMAYDMDYANYSSAPLNCSSYCLNPISPLGTYYWNDSISMTQYSSLVGAGKVILGQPYYGEVACVASPVEHASPLGGGNPAAATYVGAASVEGSPDVQPGTFTIHRDSGDAAGLDRWDTWYDNSLGCWREMYWSDATTLAVRYQMVNQMGLRGVGFWTLNYGGGSPELWSALQTYFKGCYSISASTNPPATTLAGNPVTITASAGCPDANPDYEFWILAPGAASYQLVQPYSTSSTLSWPTAGLFPGAYRLVVWARDAGSTGEFGNSSGTWDTYSSSVYTVTTRPCAAVGVVASPASPAGVGAPVTLTAQASGCPNALYQFWILAPGASSWTVAQPYSSANVLTWASAGKAPGAYRFATWVRDVSSPGTYGNSIGRWDAYGFSSYTLTTCSSVAAASAPPSSSSIGTTVTLTAHATGCSNPLYQFWFLAPGASAYTLAQPFSSNGSFSWNTTGLVPGTYHVSIWVRDSNSGGAFSNSSGSWDIFSSTTYTLTSCSAAGISSAPPATATVGTVVTFTATASCPDPKPLYEFWILAPGASTWTVEQAYSTSATLSWSTTGMPSGTYAVSVWVRDANSGGAFSNSTGSWDAFSSSQYTLR